MAENYEIIRHGNASFRVKINGKGVDFVFGSEKEAEDYVASCERMDEAVAKVQPNKIRDARKAAGLTQQAMSDLLKIPKRTIENWEGGKNNCPEWAELLIVEKLESMIDKAAAVNGTADEQSSSGVQPAAKPVTARSTLG